MGDVGSGAKALQTWVTSLWDSPKAGMLLWAGLEPCLRPGALHSPWCWWVGLLAEGKGAGKRCGFARCSKAKVLLLTTGS